MLFRSAGLVVVDVAFISLRHVLPAVARVLAPGGDVVALVKPQFEAGPRDVGKGGIVRDPATWRRVLHEVAAAAVVTGLVPAGLVASPVRGQAGNVEFLLWLRHVGADLPGAPAAGTAFDEMVTAVVAHVPA